MGLLSWRAKLWLDLRTEKAKFFQLKELERQHERKQDNARSGCAKHHAVYAVRGYPRRGTVGR